MAESKLPPGPWRVERDEEGPKWVLDADGAEVLVPVSERLGASPEVLRAIVALPLLVQAARDMLVACMKHGGPPWAAINQFDRALALVDGEGRADA